MTVVTRRSSRLLFLLLVLGILPSSDQAYGQFTDAHHYDNTPVGTNQIELAYAYARSDTSIDTSLIVTGARFHLNEGTITLTRYFGLLHRLAWAEVSVPIAGLGGSISGTNVHGSTTGAGDSSYTFATLLKGAPALTLEQFSNYKPATIVGVSLTVAAPTGQYNPDKLLNLGSDRWAFKPEIALSHPFGPEQKWQADLYANAEFYTDNTSYKGRERLRQEPLPGFEGHLSYSFTDRFWTSLDTRYSFRGDTYLDDVYQNDRQENFTLGAEASLVLTPRHSLAFVFAKALVHNNGPIYTGVSVRYSYSWGKGYKQTPP